MANDTAMKAVASQLGIVPGAANGEQKRIPEKKTFVSASCGDLSIYFGSIAWPKDDGTYDDPSPVFHAKVRGFKNNRGYDAEIPVSDDPDDLRKMARAFESIAKFIEDSGADLRRDYDVNDIDAAYKILGTNAKKKA